MLKLIQLFTSAWRNKNFSTQLPNVLVTLPHHWHPLNYPPPLLIPYIPESLTPRSIFNTCHDIGTSDVQNFLTVVQQGHRTFSKGHVDLVGDILQDVRVTLGMNLGVKVGMKLVME